MINFPIKYKNKYPVFVIGLNDSGKLTVANILQKYFRINFNTNVTEFLPIYRAVYLSKGLSDSEKMNIIADRFLNLPVIDDWITRFYQDNKDRLNFSELKNFADFIDYTFQQFNRKRNFYLWGDLISSMSNQFSELYSLFPSAKFIHVIRDGREIAVKTLEKYHSGQNVSNIARYWRYAVTKVDRFSKQLPEKQFLNIPYEQLFIDPAKTIGSIIRFLEFEDRGYQLQRFIYNNIHKEVVYKDPFRWKTELSKSQQFLFEQEAGDLLETLGYPRRWSASIILDSESERIAI